jgi:catechol 2,3-dioxygenase
MVKPKRLGHLVLRVRDVEASSRFYSDILGLEVTTSIPGRMVFMRASDESSHELALMSVGESAPGPEPDRVGLYHFAWEMESLDDLRRIYRELQQKGVNIAGISDHGISLGVYLFDPDGNEIEVFYELPRDQWPDGQIFAGRFPGSLED